MVLGIDVAADRLNYVALNQHATLFTGGVVSIEDLGRLERLAADAEVIAVDAPAQLSTEQHRADERLSEKFRPARCAEVALGRNYGIWVPWVGPTHRPETGWIATGFNLYERLSQLSAAKLIEVYPHAAFRGLNKGVRLASKKSIAGIHQRVELLYQADLGADELPLWSHDSLDAAVAAVVALDHRRGSAVPVGCGHDSSVIWMPAAARGPFIEPTWPVERFFLEAIPDGWTTGPFAAEDWVAGQDGEVEYNDSIAHPIRLRVRVQDGLLLHANNGDESDMSYRIVPLSQAPLDWL